MSTLRPSLDALLALQKIDSERDRLARSLRTLGNSSNVAAESKAAQDTAAAVQADLARAHAEQKDSELELASLEKKLKLHEDRVRSGVITNSKELINVEKEIGQLVRLRATLDEKVLTLMDEVEKLQIAKATADAEAKEQETRLKTHIDDIASDRARLETSLADLNTRRVEAAALVPDQTLLQRYETIRARSTSAGVAIGRTMDNTCGGCHMQISSIDATRALGGSQLVICDNCGRIMA
ncbi:MAG TPA: C4-type zinc ribbon domain-containing protein [Capsulimonadaceae bacterium]|jgi:hypothetical protein